MELREYLDERGRSPFGLWFTGLDAAAAARVQRALTRLEAGNTSNVKGVGTGVLELKIDFGAGYRVYFAKDGNEVVILLAVERRSGRIRTFGARMPTGRPTNVARECKACL